LKPVNTPAQYEKELLDSLLFANAEDLRQFGLMRALIASAHMLEVIADHDLQKTGLSLPRMRLLVRLYIEEKRGNKNGISPSILSRHQHISKNTISSLLASLEERQLIERTLSSEDKRSFKIRLTRAGYQLVQATLPLHNASLRQSLAALTVDDQKSLLKILSKLRESLVQRIGECELDSYKTSAT